MCKHQSGKFNDCADEYIYNSDFDDELSLYETFYGLVKAPLVDLPQPGDDPFEIKLYEVHSFNEEQIECALGERLEQYAGAILSENSNGFVTVKYYLYTTSLQNDWDNLLAEKEKEEMEDEV